MLVYVTRFLSRGSVVPIYKVDFFKSTMKRNTPMPFQIANGRGAVLYEGAWLVLISLSLIL